MLDFWRLFGLHRLWPRRVKTDPRNVPNILYMHSWPLMQRSLFNMIFCSAYAIQMQHAAKRLWFEVRATKVGTDETYWIPQTKHWPNTKYWFSSRQSFSPSDCYSLRDWRWWSWRSPASRQPLSCQLPCWMMLEGDVRKLPQFACHIFLECMYWNRWFAPNSVTLDLTNFVVVHTSNCCWWPVIRLFPLSD